MPAPGYVVRNKLPAIVRPVGPLTRKVAGYVRLTGTERSFDKDEILVAKTDLAGRITYMSAAYLRLVGMTEHEVVGAPHSILRHPLMPAEAFAELWRELKAGREHFLYLCNVTAAGDHFWALARIAPSRDGRGRLTGYHADLHRPDPGEIARIRPLYRDMRRSEAARSPRPLAATPALGPKVIEPAARRSQPSIPVASAIKHLAQKRVPEEKGRPEGRPLFR